VIVAHFGEGLTGREMAVFLANAGVILFFFLSGFLMDRALALDRNLSAYAIRRAFRILPMYWLSLLLVAAWAGGNWTLGQLLANASVRRVGARAVLGGTARLYARPGLVLWLWRRRSTPGDVGGWTAGQHGRGD